MIKVPSGPTPAHGDLPCKSGWFKFLLDEDIASKLKRVPYQKRKNWAGKPVSQNMSQRESNQGCPAKKCHKRPSKEPAPQAKERWSMYQLKAHFMPQLYWFGLIKVIFKAPYNFKIVKIKEYNMKENHFEREKKLHFRVGGRARASSGRRSTSEWNKDWLFCPQQQLHWESASKASIPH